MLQSQLLAKIERLNVEIEELNQKLQIRQQERRNLEIQMDNSDGDSEGWQAELQSPYLTEWHRTEEQFQLIAEAAPVAILISRIADGQILYGNLTAGLAFQLPLQELMKCQLLDLYVDPTEHQLVITELERSFSFRGELQCKREDGSTFWGLITACRILFEAEPTLLMVIVDISDRKLAEEALNRKDILLQMVLDNIPQLIFWKDCNSVFLGCNRRWAKAAGLRHPQEVVGKTDYDLNKHPPQQKVESESVNELYREQDQRVIRTGKPELHHIEQKQKSNGQQVWYDTNKIPIKDSKGNVIGILGTIEDITERKQAEQALKLAEEKYRSIFENALDGIFQTSADGHYISVNPSLARMYGFNSPQEMIEAVTQIGSTYVNPGKREEFVQLIRSQGEVEEFESEMYRCNGTIIWVSESAREVKDPQGKLLYYEGTVKDITRRKLAEEALRLAEAKYRKIFENAVEGIFQVMPEGQYISVNPSMALMCGYDSPEEMLKHVENSTNIYVDPSRRNEFRYYLDRHGEIKDFEYQIYHRNQTIIWVSEWARAVRTTQGELLYYEGSCIDITSRKQEEMELKRQLQELQIQVDHQKRIREVAKITQSEYFKDLQEEVRNLDLDQYWN